MTPAVLLTRIQADCDALRTKLEPLGFHCVLSPMLVIRAAENWESEIDPDAQALIFTSRHTIRASAHREDLKKMPFYVVGEQTAAAAREAGFGEPLLVAKTAGELAQYFKEADCIPTRIMYLSGEHIKRNFTAELAVHGIHVQRIIAYHAEAASGISEEAAKKLCEHKLGGVLFYSSRTAEIFLKLLRQAGIDRDVTEHCPAFCISESVADTCHKLGYCGPLLVISRPDSPAMIERLKKHFFPQQTSDN